MPPAAPDPGARAAVSAWYRPGAGEGGDEVGQAGVELGDLCCGGAFLGAEHRGGAGESEQRAGDVAGDNEVDPTDIDCAAAVDAVNEVQVLRGGGQQVAGGVEEAVAQCGEHPDAAVGAGAAAQCQHQPCAGQCQRCPDGFAEAVAGRGHRGEHPAGQGGQSAGVGDFHDGGVRRRRRSQCCGAVRSPRAPSPVRDGIRWPGRRRRCRRRRRPAGGSCSVHRPRRDRWPSARRPRRR